jgi:hypothetical protein
MKRIFTAMFLLSMTVGLGPKIVGMDKSNDTLPIQLIPKVECKKYCPEIMSGIFLSKELLVSSNHSNQQYFEAVFELIKNNYEEINQLKMITFFILHQFLSDSIKNQFIEDMFSYFFKNFLLQKYNGVYQLAESQDKLNCLQYICKLITEFIIDNVNICKSITDSSVSNKKNAVKLIFVSNKIEEYTQKYWNETNQSPSILSPSEYKKQNPYTACCNVIFYEKIYNEFQKNLTLYALQQQQKQDNENQ